MKISELPLAPSVSSTDDVPIDRSGVTYRVHYEALRGNGIASIAKTGTSGLVDTYTITFTDGSTFSYTVTNGATGSVAWGTITGTLSNQTDLQNALNAKANTSDTYTKTQVDTALSGKANTADVYTKAQTEALFTRSADYGEVVTNVPKNGAYTTPSPGILVVGCYSGKVTVRSGNSSTGGKLIVAVEPTSGGQNGAQSLFLPKGISVYIASTNETGANGIWFIPIVFSDNA